jgi:hypothetical protein
MNRTLVLFLTASALAFAQPPTGGWRRAADPVPQATQPTPPAQSADPEPVDRSDAFGQPAGQQVPVNRPAYGLPPELTVRPGTYLTVRLNQALSSDGNRPGDTFVGSLAQPLVVDGVVLAHRNQLVYGRVADAQRARSGAPSRLGLELSSITLADGSQVPIRSQMVVNRGGTTPTDVQVATVGATTATGAAIGAMAGWGTGAAIGAGVGALAGIAGVAMTKNRPTVLYPEDALTFALVEPVTISTHNAHAFRFVGPDDYDRPAVQTRLQRRPVAVAPAPYPYAYPYAYPYPWYGGVSVVVGPRWGYGYGYGYGYGRYGWGGPRYRRWW